MGVVNLNRERVSLSRIYGVLDVKNLADLLAHSVRKGEPIVRLVNATYAWSASGVEVNDETQALLQRINAQDSTIPAASGAVSAPFHLHSLNLSFAAGALVIVVGEVGSGKSSLLYAILGEMSRLTGTQTRHGTISYASQAPYVISGTIQDNILFGSPYKETRFREVVEVSQLHTDISKWEHGLQTMVDEKGSLLSGGQRARVSLARALYREADIYLLDAPLAALDPHVSNMVFQRAILGFLKDKARVVVMSDLSLIQQCPDIVLLEKGAVMCRGSFHEISKAESSYMKSVRRDDNQGERSALDGIFNSHLRRGARAKSANMTLQARRSRIVSLQLLADQQKTRPSSFGDAPKRLSAFNRLSASISRVALLTVPEVTTSTTVGAPLANISGRELVTDEPEEEGEADDYIRQISWLDFCDYLKTGAGTRVAIKVTFIVFLFVVLQALIHGTDQWMGIWSEAPVEDQQNAVYIGVYSAFVVATFVARIAIPSVLNFLICVPSSKNISKMMSENLLRGTIHYFQSTRAGKILNGFSRDTAAFDEELPKNLSWMLLYMIGFLDFCVMIAISSWQSLLVLLSFSLLFRYYGNIYLNASKRFVQIELCTRNEILSHFTASSGAWSAVIY